MSASTLIWLSLNFILLYMNYINKYNNSLVGVGISDNLRNYYGVYFGVRNRKWWWYILSWNVDFILTNSYIIYIWIHNMHGTTINHILSHCDIINSIASAWINTKNIEQRNLKFSQKSQLLEGVKLDLYSSCSVYTMTPDRSWKGWIRIRTSTTSK